jgi:hypothetical protein
MRRLLRHRLGTTFIVVLSLLLAQLALARYVCPLEADPEAMVAMMAAGQPCEGMDTQQPALCHAHAADPAKTFEALKLPAVALVAVLQLLALPLVLDARAAHAVPAMASPEAKPPPDPLFLTTLRFRV